MSQVNFGDTCVTLLYWYRLHFNWSKFTPPNLISGQDDGIRYVRGLLLVLTYKVIYSDGIHRHRVTGEQWIEELWKVVTDRFNTVVIENDSLWSMIIRKCSKKKMCATAWLCQTGDNELKAQYGLATTAGRKSTLKTNYPAVIKQRRVLISSALASTASCEPKLISLFVNVRKKQCTYSF